MWKVKLFRWKTFIQASYENIQMINHFSSHHVINVGNDMWTNTVPLKSWKQAKRLFNLQNLFVIPHFLYKRRDYNESINTRNMITLQGFTNRVELFKNITEICEARLKESNKLIPCCKIVRFQKGRNFVDK